MRTVSKVAITIAVGLLAAACAQGEAAPAKPPADPGMSQGGMMRGQGMMGQGMMGNGSPGGDDHQGMMGMMQQMSRMMDDCNKMMESRMQRESPPQGKPGPNG